MTRKIFLWLLLPTGIFIGLGALGHTLAVSHIHKALDKFPIDPNPGSMIYVVWYFLSGCFLLFGLSIVWVWMCARRGDTKPLFIAILIGLLYLAGGIGGMTYRHGDPFMWMFIVPGSLLLICSFVLVGKLQGS
jgi:O-antigen/teichoic acid export membrane protein